MLLQLNGLNAKGGSRPLSALSPCMFMHGLSVCHSNIDV